MHKQKIKDKTKRKPNKNKRESTISCSYVFSTVPLSVAAKGGTYIAFLQDKQIKRETKITQ